MRPAPTTDAWRAIAESGGEIIAQGCQGISLIQANDAAEEAQVIALALRHSLETENCRAALVTPDRNLARRVAAELARWEVAIDDSAGRPLAHAAAGVFLLLLAEAADAGFAPVPLLALLKHPFATLAVSPRRSGPCRGCSINMCCGVRVPILAWLASAGRSPPPLRQPTAAQPMENLTGLQRGGM